MFSAYDLKKILPRAIFALVAVNLSWGLMSIFIKAIDVLGNGAEKLITAPFGTLTTYHIGAGATTGALSFAVIGGLGAAFGLIPILGVAITGLFGILFAFAIALIRRVLIIGLIVIAPVAIALSVFPQTEKWAKEWWEWFSKLLLMYPFIMAFFGLSQVAAGLISQTQGTGPQEAIFQLAALALLVLPYFFVGKALSLAGGAIGKVAGMVNNKDRGMIDKTKKWEAGKVAERRSDAKAGSRYGGRNFATRGINRTLRDASLAPKTAFRSKDRKQAEILRANEEAVARFEAQHEAVKGATKDEIRVGMVAPNEKAAKASIERFVQEDVAKGGNEAESRAKWSAALAGWKAKSGTLDSAASTWALKKGAEAGVGTADDIRMGTSLIGQNLGAPDIIGKGAQPGRLGGALSAGLEPTWRSAGNALGYTPTAQDAAEFASLSTTDQTSTIGAVDGIFSGDKALPYDGLGKVKLEQAKTIRTVKNQQVQTILARVANGSMTQEQGQAALAMHAQHALTMAQAAGEQNNTGAAEEAAAFLQDMGAAIDTHNSSLPPLPAGVAPRNINANQVENDGFDQAKTRVSPLK